MTRKYPRYYIPKRPEDFNGAFLYFKVCSTKEVLAIFAKDYVGFFGSEEYFYRCYKNSVRRIQEKEVVLL